MTSITLKIPFQGTEFLLSISEARLVNLNSVYEIVNNPKNKSPADWKRLDTTKNLIDSIANDNTGNSRIIESKRGKNGGTWAHWQLALSYAQYLSPELHIAVNSVFKERLEELVDPELGIDRSKERARKTWKSQGKSDQWIAKREEGKVIRTEYVNTLINHEVKPGAEVGRCSNEVYKGIFRRGISEIEAELRQEKPDLPKKVNIRDHAKLSSIAAISLAEALSSETIEELNINGVDNCAKVSLEKGISVRSILHESSTKNELDRPKKETTDANKERNLKHIRELRAKLGK